MAAGDLTTIEKVKLELGLTGRPVTGVTRANPGVVTCQGHGFVQNQKVVVSDLAGMVQLNGQVVTVTPVDDDSFSIGVDTTSYADYSGGGYASADDVILAQYITAQSGWFVSQLGRRAFLQAVYSDTAENRSAPAEVRDGDGSRAMTPYNLPVSEVLSVTVDGEVVPQRSAPGEPGWALVNDRICLDDYATGNPFPGDYAPYYVDGSRWRFTRGVGNVVFSYVGGNLVVPPEVDQAVVELVAYRYRNRDRIGIRARTLGGGTGGETVTFMVDACPPSVQAIIDRYYVPNVA